jgi:hypothetical protein
MQLSDTDKKLVARLKKRQQQLIRWRWVGLLAALVSIGAGFYIYEVLVRITVHFIQQPEDIGDALLGIGYLFPVLLVLHFGGFGLLIYLSTVWNGKPEVRLLLRLIEESQKDDA